VAALHSDILRKTFIGVDCVFNMIKKILLMAIVLTGLVLSGCIEDGVRMADDNNTADAPANVTDNVTANESEPVERRSVSIPLERPPFIGDE